MSDGDGGALSFRVLPFDSLDSTNEEARRQLRAGAPAGTVVWARRQQAGRGRRGRAWVSDEGNLFCSLIVRPDCPPGQAAQVSLVTALAVAEAAEAVLAGAAPVRVKWPNDVLAGGRKLAGILLEADTTAGGGAPELPGAGSGAGAPIPGTPIPRAPIPGTPINGTPITSAPIAGTTVAGLVVGVGINIAHAPEGTEFPATSLAAEGAAGLLVAGVLDGFLSRFAAWYRLWSAEGLAPVRAAWLARAAGLDGPVTVRLHRETLSGSFIGLDGDGALLLDPADGGPVRRIAAGDVFFPVSSC